jgi:hypothetical protein
MSDRTVELAERRAALLVRAAVQRRVVAREVEAVEARLQNVDRFLAVGRRFLSHPAVIASGIVVVALLGRARAFRLIGQGLLLTRGIRSLLRSARGRI